MESTVAVRESFKNDDIGEFISSKFKTSGGEPYSRKLFRTLFSESRVSLVLYEPTVYKSHSVQFGD